MLDREVQQYPPKDLCLCSVLRIVEDLEKKNYDIPNTIRYDGVSTEVRRCEAKNKQSSNEGSIDAFK